jgi:hypothetical protein
MSYASSPVLHPLLHVCTALYSVLADQGFLVGASATNDEVPDGATMFAAGPMHYCLCHLQLAVHTCLRCRLLPVGLWDLETLRPCISLYTCILHAWPTVGLIRKLRCRLSGCGISITFIYPVQYTACPTLLRADYYSC